jgi:hypothetical protein
MNEDQVKLKIVKDTVINSILSEVSSKLKSKISEEEKRKEMLIVTRSKLVSILNSLGKEDLLPKGDPKSPQDFEDHILKVIQKTRRKLLVEMESEY